MRTYDEIMKDMLDFPVANPVRLCEETKAWVFTPATLEEGANELMLHLASIEPLRQAALPDFEAIVKDADAMTPETMQAQINARREKRVVALNALYERIYQINGNPEEWMFFCVREHIRLHGLSLLYGSVKPDPKGITDQGFANALEELSQYNIGPGDYIRVEPEEFMDSSKPNGYLVRITNELLHAKFGGLKFVKLFEVLNFR